MFVAVFNEHAIANALRARCSNNTPENCQISLNDTMKCCVNSTISYLRIRGDGGGNGSRNHDNKGRRFRKMHVQSETTHISIIDGNINLKSYITQASQWYFMLIVLPRSEEYNYELKSFLPNYLFTYSSFC